MHAAISRVNYKHFLIADFKAVDDGRAYAAILKNHLNLCHSLGENNLADTIRQQRHGVASTIF